MLGVTYLIVEPCSLVFIIIYVFLNILQTKKINDSIDKHLNSKWRYSTWMQQQQQNSDKL